MAARRGRIKKLGPPVLRADLHKRSEIRTTLGNPNYIKSTPIRRRAGAQVSNYECLRYPMRATGF